MTREPVHGTIRHSDRVCAKEQQIITLRPPCLTVGVTHWGTILSPTRRRTKTLPDEPKISNFDSSVHKTLQFSVVHWRCFMAQASLFFLFYHLSNGFLSATRPVEPATRSLLFTVETETSLLRAVLSCAWSCFPVSRPSRKLLTLRNLSSDCVVALGLPELLLSVSSSFQVPFDGVENFTHWHLGLLCNFSKGKTYILRVIMVCLSSFVNCHFLTIMIAIYYFLQCNIVQIMLQGV